MVRPPPMGPLPEPAAAEPPSPEPLPPALAHPAFPQLSDDDVREALGHGGYPLSGLDALVQAVEPEPIREAVQSVYERRGGAFVWSDGPELLPAARRILRLLGEAEDHGVRADALRSRELVAMGGALDENQTAVEAVLSDPDAVRPLLTERGKLFARLDAQLTSAALGLARQLGATSLSGKALGNALPEERELDAWAAALVPWHPQYQRLVTAMARYRRYARGRSFNPIPWPKPLANLGKTGADDAVLALRERLWAEEFLDKREAVRNAGLDAAVKRGVVRFQKSRGLDATGRVDAETARLLDLSPSELVGQIGRALREWRASPTRWQRTFLEVNLPEYAVELYVAGRRVARHRAVIGYAYGSGGGLTKRFHSQVVDVTLNPGWTPSDDILLNELLPGEEVEPGQLARKGFTWFTRPDGRRGVYQLPGDKNALGRAAIRFADSKLIYLHGVPALQQDQFEAAMRAKSHGCVRVEGVEALAWRILEHDGTLARAEFDEALTSKRSRTVALTQALPIHFEYVAVVVDDDGVVRFLPNVYRQ